MNAYPTTSGPLEDISPRTVELIEAAAELLLLSRRSRPDAGRHEWQSFTATVLPLLFDDEITADDICDAIEIASRQGGQVMSKARDLINAHLIRCWRPLRWFTEPFRSHRLRSRLEPSMPAWQTCLICP